MSGEQVAWRFEQWSGPGCVPWQSLRLRSSELKLERELERLVDEAAAHK